MNNQDLTKNIALKDILYSLAVSQDNELKERVLLLLKDSSILEKVEEDLIKEFETLWVESSFITFLQRVKYKNYKGNDMIYRMKLNSFNKDRLERAQNSLCDCLDTNIDNFKLRLLYLMINVLDNYK